MIPAKPDMGEQLGAEFMKLAIADPEKFEKMMPLLAKFADQQEPESS